MNASDRSKLIDSLIEGEISEADFLSLEAEFCVDDKARQEYLDRLQLNALLSEVATRETVGLSTISGELNSDIKVRPISVRKPQPASSRVRSTQWAVGTIAAVLLIALAGAWVMSSLPMWNETAGDQPNDGLPSNTVANADGENESFVAGFAVLSRQESAVWRAPHKLVPGSLVPSGMMTLESGVAEFELFSGVNVVVEGQAEFEIESPMVMRVARGRVRARVPEAAHGFRITTSDGELVDLGTEFAIDVGDEKSELHVLEGAVEWHPLEQPMATLNDGDAVSWGASGQTTSVPADPTRFVGRNDLSSRIASSQAERIDQWQESQQRRADDPRLVVLYQIGDSAGSERTLLNRVTSRDNDLPSSNDGHGAIVAAARDRDRWGRDNSGLDFSPAGSRVRLSVDEELGELTLVSWVRINSLDRWYNSLFLTDGHEQSEPHWQIMDDGRLFFSVKKRDNPDRSRGERDKHIFYSPSFWSPELSGQWVMLATTYDVQNRTVCHYLNGEQLSREQIPAGYAVPRIKIGNASLGNWGMPERKDPHFAIRNLNGTMDEFALYNAALSAEEIKELYDDGRP